MIKNRRGIYDIYNYIYIIKQYGFMNKRKIFIAIISLIIIVIGLFIINRMIKISKENNMVKQEVIKRK